VFCFGLHSLALKLGNRGPLHHHASHTMLTEASALYLISAMIVFPFALIGWIKENSEVRKIEKSRL